MKCIGIENIISTTIVYEDFFYYNEFLKVSNDSVNKLKEIENKYTDNDNKQNNNLYLRKFIYRFKDYILIESIVYPLESKNIKSIEVIDLSNNVEEKVMEINVNNYDQKVNILLNRRYRAIELRVKSKNNIFPMSEEIKIIESI
ncbi:hypothetical protein H9660_00075 [Clostridium sp. Sa3CUN1]|uniref:Uncharacterized protein n=1 Tax=Clostridium gallinarum TaxID=2762246 RepID=A0ABR8PZD4_9CLOT|nr:hypothetical protein [Clostridium gallinarum]MBD7913532.1 hypothetical protein [Clostridium gallinarum]